MIALQVPSNRQRPIGATEIVGILLLVTKVESIKQSEEPESIRVQVERECSEMDRVVKRESGLERADALSQTNVAMQKRSTQPSACVAFS